MEELILCKQILCLYDALDAVDCDKIVQYIVKLQNEDGSFSGDQWGEVDTRFSMCAVKVLLDFKKTLNPTGLFDWNANLSCIDGWSGVCVDSSDRVTEL